MLVVEVVMVVGLCSSNRVGCGSKFVVIIVLMVVRWL